MTAGDPVELVRLIRRITTEETGSLRRQWGDGTAETVEGSYAAVRKAGATVATPGFFIPPHLTLEPGDHVFWFDAGGYKRIIDVLNRNAVIPDDLELHDLTLTGRLVRASKITPPALTADTDNWMPDGLAEAYWIRIDQDPGDFELRGMAFEADAEHGLVNISAGDLTIPDNASTSEESARFLTPAAAAHVIRPNGITRVWGDPDSNRWRVIAP
jgi:hypothetical protein